MAGKVTAKPKPKNPQKKRASVTATRWTEDDLKLQDWLKTDTGLTTNSELLRFCIRETAKLRGYK